MAEYYGWQKRRMIAKIRRLGKKYFLQIIKTLKNIEII
jgi:hypothetical protein